MCVVFLWRRENGTNGKIKFILAANRDEYFTRPAKEAQFWEEDLNVLAGKDLAQNFSGGTWIGMTRQWKVSFVTNIVDEFFFHKNNKKGRRFLVSDFLTNQQRASEYLQSLEEERLLYKPFNLVCGDFLTNEFYYANSVNEAAAPIVINSETVCISNGTMDCKWFKVVKGREKFHQLVANNVNEETDKLIEELLAFLTDTESHYPDPNMIVESTISKHISSIFLTVVPRFGFGTRTNTVVIVDEKNHVTFLERTMLHPDDPVSKWKQSVFEFDLVSTHLN